jgi:GT2 family glycosyltransferase
MNPSLCRTALPAIKIIKNNANFGFAQDNEALKHIDAEIYALVNSDIYGKLVILL